MNHSENQLQGFCKHREDGNLIMHFELHPQGDYSAISPAAVNLCIIESHGRKYLFGGISEAFYNKMVDLYHYDY